MDLRIPSGWLFLLLGVILIAMSFTGASAPMTEVNVNLYAGGVMTLFGGVMLWLSRRAIS